MTSPAGRAAPNTFTLEVVTPTCVAFTGPVTAVVAPAARGYLGILARHAPLLATLTPGTITFRAPDGTVSSLHGAGGGILEVRDNRVTILADQIAASAPFRGRIRG